MSLAAQRMTNDDPTFYPDNDDMGESVIQRLIAELLRPLLARFLTQRGVLAFVGADNFIYWRKGDPSACVAPDIYVLPGLDPDSSPPCWKVWETNVAPTFALEIVSLKGMGKDVSDAPERHDELGTKELVVFDPFVGDRPSKRKRFRLHRRNDAGKLVLVEATNRELVQSTELDCTLRAVGRGARLRLRVGTGSLGEKLFPTDDELSRAALEALEAERAARQAEHKALEAERRALEAERVARAELEAELLALRAKLERTNQ